MKKFGDLVTEQRLSLGLTLRAFCIKNNVNAVILSKVERNIQLPKQEEMKNFIAALKIFESSVEHAELLKSYECFSPDQYHFSSTSLPLFFRSDLDLDQVVDYLRDADGPEDLSLFRDV